MSVLAVYNVEHASSLVYYGLHSMQHRGQEGCGMVSVAEDGHMQRHRGHGLVQEVFNEAQLSKLDGKMCLGHVLYTTANGRSIDNIEPLSFLHNTGSFAIAHNGNIVNAKQIRDYLESKGSLFQSNTNAELLAHLIKKEADEPRIFTIMEALDMLEGSFAFVIMTQNRIYACRDKYGIRPLAIGKLGDGYVVSSETCAFDVMGAEFVRDVAPGEIVTIDHNGLRSRQYSLTNEHNMCAME